MRKLLVAIVILAVLAAVIALYLYATTPRESAGLRFPLTPAQRGLIAQVPSSAEGFAFVPKAAALEAKLRANPITRDAVDSWTRTQSLPRPWMIGGGDVLAWRDADGVTRYLLRLDPLRAFIVRTYGMLGGRVASTLLINAPAEQPIEAAELDSIVRLADRLPPGDALIVQRVASRGAYPPIGRPAVTSVSVTPAEIDLTSRALRDASDATPQITVPAKFPRGAMLTSTFASMPRLVEDLNRLFGAKVSPLLENGGTIAIYDIDARKLLPRPLGVIAVPADPTRRAAFQQFVDKVRQGEIVGVHVRTAERGGELLLSFDSSLDLYLSDQFEPGRWPAGRWSLRADPRRLVPALRAVSDHLGLRIASRRLYQAARELDRWIDPLGRATTIEAVDGVDGSTEELRVAITAK